METLTLNELREQPEKLDPLLKEGKTVRVTKDGQPYFDAVPANPTPFRQFVKQIDEVWAGSGVEISTEEIVRSLRKSRE
jgi:hypothetical protein